MKRGSRIIFLVLCVSFLTAGCATTNQQYQSGFGSGSDGDINILLSRVSPQVSVVIDEKIVLDSRWLGTRRVNVIGVPPGEHTVHVFANSWQLASPLDEKRTISVSERASVPVVVQVPQYSTLYWVYVIALGVVSALPAVVVYY